MELTEPWKAVQQAGGTPHLVATDTGEVQTFDHLDKADTFEVDQTTKEVRVEDIRNAGGTWVDEEVHVDGNLISSRKPDDLPAFCAALVEATAGS